MEIVKHYHIFGNRVSGCILDLHVNHVAGMTQKIILSVLLWAPANVGEQHCLVCPERLVASQEYEKGAFGNQLIYIYCYDLNTHLHLPQGCVIEYPASSKHRHNSVPRRWRQIQTNKWTIQHKPFLEWLVLSILEILLCLVYFRSSKKLKLQFYWLF